MNVNYKKLSALSLVLGLALTNLVSTAKAKELEEVVIIGGGITGMFHANKALDKARKSGSKIRVTIYEKNNSLDETTAANIGPSLTVDEPLAVLPRGKALVEKCTIPFNQPGGIQVLDVPNIADSEATRHFMHEAEIDSHDQVGYEKRTKAFLTWGQEQAMPEWVNLDAANQKLHKIMDKSNYFPCREPRTKDRKVLRDGYRIDLIYGVADAVQRAESMKADYEGLGYKHCALLSPVEVMAIDPYLTDFCKSHATADKDGKLQWKSDSVALWRPGGCIDAKTFLPLFCDYLKEEMGTFVDEKNKTHNCFNIVYGKEVSGVILEEKNNKTSIKGLQFKDGSQVKHATKNCVYAFCPGEAVGTLKKLGFKEPAYAAFAGASLRLTIPIPEDKKAKYANFRNCMEIHINGDKVLAFQAGYADGDASMVTAGTKSYYGDQRPTKDQAFAKDRNLHQLNAMNEVLPELVSLALGRDTKGQTLTQADMDTLELEKGIAKRWAGVRAAPYDGFATLGLTYTEQGAKVDNAIVTTHLGSGGVSFGPAAVTASWAAYDGNSNQDDTLTTVLSLAKSDRCAQAINGTSEVKA